MTQKEKAMKERHGMKKIYIVQVTTRKKWCHNKERKTFPRHELRPTQIDKCCRKITTQ